MSTKCVPSRDRDVTTCVPSQIYEITKCILASQDDDGVSVPADVAKPPGTLRLIIC